MVAMADYFCRSVVTVSISPLLQAVGRMKPTEGGERHNLWIGNGHDVLIQQEATRPGRVNCDMYAGGAKEHFLDRAKARFGKS